MIITFSKEGKDYSCDLSKGIDLSIGISNENSPQCFYAEKPEIKPFQMGDFVGSIKEGSPVNYYTVLFNPHGNGTHTECVGHINAGFQKINDHHQTTHCLSQLITVDPIKKDGDRVITRDLIEVKLRAIIVEEALIIRTTPNENSKRTKNYTGQNPTYLSENAIQFLVSKGVKHLLVDIPSVDKEKDEGALVSHKAFWNINETVRLDATITELIYVPENIEDGRYLLNLQRANFDMDCAPSRPIIYPFVEKVRKLSDN